MSDLPRLSTIAPGISFTDALAEGVFEAYGSPENPLALTKVLILLPTRRAVRSLTEAFSRVAEARGAGAVLLPRIQPLGDVDEEILMLEGFGLDSAADLAVPPAIGELPRAFELARLIAAMMEKIRTPATPDQCVALAFSLSRFLDTAHTERVSLDGLETLAPERFSKHWQDTIVFLDIIRKAWPDHLDAEGKLDPADRRNQLLGVLAQRWRDNPPAHPIIAAGTTGSIPATADLLKVIASLPTGHIVLPGLDLDMPRRAWDALEPSHPQFGLHNLLAHLEAERSDIRIWPHGESRVPSSRLRLINEALRPSAATDEWINTAKEIAQDHACDGLSFLVAQHTGEEARAIALALREAVDTPGRTAALVTPDRTLARRVSAELKRFDLYIDDSAGVPLDQTPPATFLLHLAEAAAENWRPVPLLSLLKHPFFQMGNARGEIRASLDALERQALRGMCLSSGLPGLFDDLSELRAAIESKTARESLSAALTLVSKLKDMAEPLETLQGRRSLSAWVEAHLAVAAALTVDENGRSDTLWHGRAGEKLSELLNGLLGADGAPGAMTLPEYSKLLRRLMARQLVRLQEGVHPRLSIWGPLEARLQQANLIILGGLVEGVWPGEVTLDPWLSRPMRSALGLSSPERQIGLAAHDFAQLAASPQVILSRAEKVDGKPAVPSRWWLRLENLLKGSGLPTVDDLTVPHAEWARRLDGPDGPPAPVAAPKPTPPVEARPRDMRVTSVQNWIRDPYSIYAHDILKLNALEEIDREPGPSDRGNLLHGIMEDFTRAFPARLPDEARAKLIEIGARHFEQYADVPQVRAIWWPRFLRVVDWIIDFETRYREKVKTALSEVPGTLTFDAGGKPFTLRARADRIDLMEDGAVGITDYKTGALPLKDSCETGLQPQLTLEAAMVARGGFGKDVPPRVGELRYISLKGAATPGEERIISDNEDRTIDLAENAFENFIELIKEFDDANRPYPSQPRPRLANAFGDFDHLARRLEWSVAGGEDGGGND